MCVKFSFNRHKEKVLWGALMNISWTSFQSGAEYSWCRCMVVSINYHPIKFETTFLAHATLQGIWTLCINLSENEVKELRSKGFPSREHCVNYLANNENARNNEDSRPDWQHSESQTPLRPHLSRYNKEMCWMKSQNSLFSVLPL